MAEVRQRDSTLLRTALCISLAIFAAPALTEPYIQHDSAELRSKGYELAYNLDHAEAVAMLRRAVAIAPDDSASHRALAAVTWLQILFRHGTITVDHYLGGAAKGDVKLKPPPPELARQFREHADRAIALSEQRVQRAPNDPRSHFDLGSSLGLLASYTASVEGRVLGALRAARRAYNAHERVLQLDTRRKDAALTVGTYRYLVSTLSMPARWMAYIVGFGGGRDEGIRMVETAAAFGGDSQTDARFALILLYNRERRYQDALRVVAELQRRFPRNRLLWLEGGSTALRASQFAAAEMTLSQGIAMAARDARPRAGGEEVLWHYKRGLARVALKRDADATDDLRRAVAAQGQQWARGRAHLELGKLADRAGDRTRAHGEYDRAIALCAGDNDPRAADEARRLKATGYR